MHVPVIGQRNTPDTRLAHNNDIWPTGTGRSGATQPAIGAIETFRVPTCGSNDEAFQHNNGAGFDADQFWVLPTHTLLKATRLTTPDDEFKQT
jgi:hypothetical protein